MHSIPQGLSFAPNRTNIINKVQDICSSEGHGSIYTKYIINPSSIEKMRQGVMLINTGRGGLIETKAALDGMKSGRIGYLGLDVYEREKGVFFSDRSNNMNFDPILKELTENNNILLTGHQGFFTKESLEVIIKTTYSNLSALLSHNNCENRLT